jgi:hypothetical protein
MTPFEVLAATMSRSAAASSVIRPAAVLPDSAAREVLVELAHADVRGGGCWATGPTLWQRYDRPWDGPDGGPGDAVLLGSLRVRYGTPTPYAITLYRAALTDLALEHGWTVEALADEVLALGGYTLAGCPRLDLAPLQRRSA